MNSQAKKVKNEILASKISVIRSLNNEQALKYELTLFFQNLKKSVLRELEEYYSDEFMFQAHADLILAPIFEAQQEYYNILRKFNHKEYQFGRKTGRRLVKLARKKAKRNSIAYADKASKTPSILKATIKKDELFGTNPWAEQKLLNQTFTASERTMNRIDSDINQILSDGYREGKGINVVRNDIIKRFDQLSSWEATRIARTEIHNAHNMGTMDIYQEMGVEYTQWIAAHDSRTRISHLDVDREIIPMGGTYSNGLRYPGDTTGPLKEWINCRCSIAPFVIPDGYIAPSFAPFKEEDLIPTLDYWNQDELITQATQEAQENISVPQLSPEDERKMKDWYDLFHRVEQNYPKSYKYIDKMFKKYEKSPNGFISRVKNLFKGESKLNAPTIKEIGGYDKLKLKESQIPTRFPSDNTPISILEKENVKRSIDDFNDYMEYHRESDPNMEYLEVLDINGNSILFKRGREFGIELNGEDLKTILNKNGVILIHNHPSKFNNVHSFLDLSTQLKYNFKYSVVESYTKRYIVVNKNSLSNDVKQRIIRELEQDEKEFKAKIKKIVDNKVNKLTENNNYDEHYVKEVRDEIYEEVTKDHIDEFEEKISNYFGEHTGLKLIVHDR